MLESQTSEVVRSASIERVLGVLKHIAKSRKSLTRKLVEFAYKYAKKHQKHVGLRQKLLSLYNGVNIKRHKESR